MRLVLILRSIALFYVILLSPFLFEWVPSKQFSLDNHINLLH